MKCYQVFFSDGSVKVVDAEKPAEAGQKALCGVCRLYLLPELPDPMATKPRVKIQTIEEIVVK